MYIHSHGYVNLQSRTEVLVSREDYFDATRDVYARCSTIERHSLLADCRMIHLTETKDLFSRACTRICNVIKT